MTINDPQKIEEALNKGVEDVIVKEDLRKKLLSGKKIRLYLGVDPTGFDLHIGHAVVLWKLREFQELGHEIVLLIGDFTARIGDPSGKDAARIPLTEKQIEANMKDYKKQASKILDFSKVKIKYNSTWLAKLKFEDILKLASNFTVQQMIQRDMFQRRIKVNAPISLQEFMYPLMQGYDSVAMDVDLEVGGNDQMFNMLAGRTMQKIYNNKDKDVLTCKLLLGTDGRKMSKTYNNFIAIEDKPNDMFGKVMSIKDELIDQYFELATRLSQKEVIEIKKISGNPRDTKAKLAEEIVKLYHGEKEAARAEKDFNRIFKDKELPSDMPEYISSKEEMFLPELLHVSGVAPSVSEAKRLIIGGAVEIDNKIQREWKINIKIYNDMTIRVGKRRFVKVKMK